VIPEEITQSTALLENLFAIIVGHKAMFPVGVVGLPATSKTLSFQILNANLHGKGSATLFCQKYPAAVDATIIQCSENTDSKEIDAIFGAAERREESAVLERKGETLVFLDEAGLPDRSHRMVLKALQYYLDAHVVSANLISNTPFDVANTNRMLTATRFAAEGRDFVVLARGCLGLTKGRSARSIPVAGREGPLQRLSEGNGMFRCDPPPPSSSAAAAPGRSSSLSSPPPSSLSSKAKDAAADRLTGRHSYLFVPFSALSSLILWGAVFSAFPP
jgi:hypothetical protein